jgi:protein TonB
VNTRYVEIGIRLAISIAVALGLFLLMPFVHAFFKQQTKDIDASRLRSNQVMVNIEQKKQKAKVEKQTRKVQSSMHSRRRSAGDMFDFKFAPDLTVGSGEGVAIRGENLENIVYDESETDEPAVPISVVPVRYPPRAREIGAEGTAEIVLVIDRSGKVASIDFISVPHLSFKNAIREAVLRWRFRPAKKDGVPVQMRLRQPLEFKLENDNG